MRMVDLIFKKRNGRALSQEEIHWMIQNYTAGIIPDYQMSAMTMAIYFKGMSKDETFHLAMEMADSGDRLDLSMIPGMKVDKHSTGGVGDKTSLVLAPAVAALGVPVAKMSGRGLGHTGGTIDKLESIPGFSTDLSEEQFISNVKNHGICVMGATKNLAPADKLLYALRDVTATVDQISLIASSVMSKKLASGADAIVLDVKLGNGAFVNSLNEARNLAAEMISIGERAGKKMTAVLTDMNQPLGNAVGNRLEVMEAVKTLQGNGPSDLKQVVMILGACMLMSAGQAANIVEGQGLLATVIADGRALKKFMEFAETMGGDPAFLEDPEKMILARYQEEIPAKTKGSVSYIDTQAVGRCSMILGGGRETKDDVIDPDAGIVLHKKLGDSVAEGESLATIYGSDPEKMKKAKDYYYDHIKIEDREIRKNPVILEVLAGEYE